MKRIFSGSTFERDIGYARAVIDDAYVHVSGTTGYDYERMEIPESPVAQAEQCLATIRRVLEEAGASLADVVRVHYIAPSRADFEACWPVFRASFGDHPPAATMWVAELYDPAMKIEIEVTAALPNRARYRYGSRVGRPGRPSVIPRTSRRRKRWFKD